MREEIPCSLHLCRWPAALWAETCSPVRPGPRGRAFGWPELWGSGWQPGSASDVPGRWCRGSGRLWEQTTIYVKVPHRFWATFFPRHNTATTVLHCSKVLNSSTVLDASGLASFMDSNQCVEISQEKQKVQTCTRILDLSFKCFIASSLLLSWNSLFYIRTCPYEFSQSNQFNLFCNSWV